jgi:hypothetical protein
MTVSRPVLKLKRPLKPPSEPVAAPAVATEPAVAQAPAQPVPPTEPLAVPQPPPPPEVSSDRFYFVWAIGGAAPRRRHPTRESALTEVRRLRKVVLEKEFAVYEARRVVEELP